MVYLIKTTKESTLGARAVSVLIIMTSMGDVINFETPIGGLQGFQPIHFFWVLAFVIVLYEFRSSRSSIDFPKFFTIPIFLFITIYIIGILVTATAWPNHTFFK
jgi:hypothetical protein